jgi:hypothetical protein
VANKGIYRGWNHCRVGPVESIHAVYNLEKSTNALLSVLCEIQLTNSANANTVIYGFGRTYLEVALSIPQRGAQKFLYGKAVIIVSYMS